VNERARGDRLTATLKEARRGWLDKLLAIMAALIGAG
jgi:hypothetical protein